MRPFWQYFHGRFYDYRKTRDYKHGIRSIFSIEYEKPCGQLLSKDDVWCAPTVGFKITCGWLMFNGWILWGKITKSGWGPIDINEEIARDRRFCEELNENCDSI